MSLEEIGREILEVLAVQSRIAPLREKLTKLGEKLAEAENAVKEADAKRTENVKLKEKADIDAEVAGSKVQEAEQAVSRAKDILYSARKEEVRIQKIADQYNEELFGQLDQKITECITEKDGIQSNIDEVTKELENTQADLAQRQADLKEKGFEVNLTPEIIRKKTTYF